MPKEATDLPIETTCGGTLRPVPLPFPDPGDGDVDGVVEFVVEDMVASEQDRGCSLLPTLDRSDIALHTSSHTVPDSDDSAGVSNLSQSPCRSVIRVLGDRIGWCPRNHVAGNCIQV